MHEQEEALKAKIWQRKNYLAQLEQERADLQKRKGPLRFPYDLSRIRNEIDKLEYIQVKPLKLEHEKEKKDKVNKKRLKSKVPNVCSK